MRFDWQGFGFEHPDDWAPGSIQGNRTEGYVRIASGGNISCQVRWKAHKHAQNLDSILDGYRSRLEKDARRARMNFEFHREAVGDRFHYRYSGTDQGRGAILWSESCHRVFFVEAVAPRRESILGPFRELVQSFQSFGEGPREQWSMFGLEVRAPYGLHVGAPLLQAGRTRIDGKARAATVRMERWGFGHELVQRHGLIDWARNALNLTGAAAEECDDGIRLTMNRRWRSPVLALVRFEEDRNQLVAVRVESKKEAWQPAWDWFRS